MMFDFFSRADRYCACVRPADGGGFVWQVISWADLDGHRVAPTVPPPAVTEENLSALPVQAYAVGAVAVEDARCTICLGDYEAGDTLRTLLCQHHFHKECVDQWLRKSRHCPLCTQDVATAENVHGSYRSASSGGGHEDGLDWTRGARGASGATVVVMPADSVTSSSLSSPAPSLARSLNTLPLADTPSVAVGGTRTSPAYHAVGMPGTIEMHEVV
jgi:hypothetical protein